MNKNNNTHLLEPLNFRQKLSQGVFSKERPMDFQTLELIKGWIFLPIVGAAGYFIKKNFSDIESLREQVAMLKISQAVADSQIKDIREDIKDLVKVVREVEATIVGDIKLLQKDIRDKIK